MRTIILPESCTSLLKESQEEVTFFKFFTELKKFIVSLLEDPVNAVPQQFFTAHGLDAKTLKNKMIERNIIVRKEKIDEPADEDGNVKSMYHVSYSVPKQNFKKKVRRLYQEVFEK